VSATNAVANGKPLGTITPKSTAAIENSNLDKVITCDIADWEKLFRVSADKTEVTLRFFPDSGTKRRDDALLLIVYAYKIILGYSKIHQIYAHSALNEMLRVAPGSPLSPIEKMMFIIPSNEKDYGANLVDGGYLRRDSLSKGGYYSVTSEGETRARYLSIDAIERA